MKKLVVSLLLCSSLTAFAASESASKDSISKGESSAAVPSGSSALLATLGSRSKVIQSLQGSFVQQKHISVLPVPLNSTGKFNFEQGKGVNWETLTPVQNVIHLTPKGITFGDGNGKTSTQPAGVEVVAKIFMGVITGELESLNNYFSVVASGSENQWKLVLTPRSANLATYIQTIELQGREFTELLNIVETNGDKTNIQFTTEKVVRKAE